MTQAFFMFAYPRITRYLFLIEARGGGLLGTRTARAHCGSGAARVSGDAGGENRRRRRASVRRRVPVNPRFGETATMADPEAHEAMLEEKGPREYFVNGV